MDVSVRWATRLRECSKNEHQREQDDRGHVSLAGDLRQREQLWKNVRDRTRMCDFRWDTRLR